MDNITLRTAVTQYLNQNPPNPPNPPGPIDGWDTTGVTDMQNLFKDAKDFNGDISDWDTSNVLDMSGMFDGAEVFNQDISEWNVSEVSHMDNMFRNAAAFDQNLERWKPSNVTHANGMLKGAVSFNSKLPTFDNIMFYVDWLQGTKKLVLREKAVKQFTDMVTRQTCTRCFTVYNEIDNVGRWQCSFHPGSYDTVGGYGCCGRRHHSPRSTRWERLGYEPDRVVRTHSGCTPCDHGLNLVPIVLNDMLDVANYLDPATLRHGSKVTINGKVIIRRFMTN